MGRAGLLPHGRRAAGRPAEILRAGDVPVPERQDPHGARAQLRARRRRRALQARARLRRDAPDGVGRVRPAGGERGARPRHPSRHLDPRQHRRHARRAAAHGPLARLVARVRHLRPRLLRAPAEAVPRPAPRRPGGPARELGELGPDRWHRAGQRAGDRRPRLALRRRGREAAARAMVLPHHPVRARAAGGARHARPLAGAGAHHAGALDRPQRGRPGALPASGRSAGPARHRGVHHPAGHAVRHVVHRGRAGPPGRGRRRRRPAGRGFVHRRVPRARHQRGGDRDGRKARLRHRPARRPPVPGRSRPSRSGSPISC